MHARSTSRRRAGTSVVALVIVAGLLGGCGGPTPVASPGPTAAQTAAATAATTTAPPVTATPQPSGPATLQLNVVGDPNVTGAWSSGTGVNCNNPTLAGLNILAFATSPDAQSIVVLTFTPGKVSVSERSSSGASATAREFTGTGVSAYDPARGATFDSDVEIVPTPGIKPGTLGKITHVSGSVDCAGQTTGTSTVVVSGASAEGPISGSFTSFRVICGASASDGNSATIIAVIDTATPPVYLIVGLPANGKATLFTLRGDPQQQHSYAVDPAGAHTISPTGAHLDADFTEVLAAGASGQPHVIHLAGDVTCGTFNKS